jgi:uridine kinase
MESLVDRIHRSAAPAEMTTKIVAIDGCGGAGKSTLAASLAHDLGTVPIIHTDDFASWDEPINWWPRLREQVLEPFRRGEPARYQRYDWLAKSLADWIVVLPPAYVVLEGVSATRRAFAPYLTFKIWVDTPAEVRFRRGIERDGPEMADQWRLWMAAEDEYVAREQPDERADAVVSGVDRLPRSARRRG